MKTGDITDAIRAGLREHSRSSIELAAEVRAELAKIREEQARQGEAIRNNGKAVDRVVKKLDGNGKLGLVDEMTAAKTEIQAIKAVLSGKKVEAGWGGLPGPYKLLAGVFVALITALLGVLGVSVK